MTSDLAAADAGATSGQGGGSAGRRSILWYLIPIAIVLDIAAFVLFPPFDKADPKADCPFPTCFVASTLHLPAPHVIAGEPPSTDMITAQVSLTDSLLTMVLLSVIVLVGLILLARGRAMVPGPAQNFIEWAMEGLEGFARGMGGAAAARYVPIFACYFILILIFNWSGLIPLVGRIDGLRAPTSDVNVTIGLALVAFIAFHVEGFRRLAASPAMPASSSRSTSSGRGRRGHHRAVRGARGADARVRQAADALDATLWQHLWWRSRPGRGHRAHRGVSCRWRCTASRSCSTSSRRSSSARSP
ncbi:MAG: F0F1 ATP synthase subunit A [Chloroflexota bacterium]